MSPFKIDVNRINCLQGADFSCVETQQEIFSLIESFCAIINRQNEKIQELEDELNHMKGEKGKPKFKANTKDADEQNGNQQMEAKTRKKWKKSSKVDRIKIDRTETVKLDKMGLPDDISFKGYEEKLVQNIIIKTDNVLYRLEKYYSPSTHKTYTAAIDESLKGTEFGAETKALISTLYYENRVTENKIASFLNANGLRISEGTISNILVKEKSEKLSEIKSEIFEAGLKSSVYQQIDDTGMKIAGKNAYATIVCNEKYSAFFIGVSKSRKSVQAFLTAMMVSLFTVLVCDDAPQFKSIAGRLALCWVHEERHYKKLNPVLECHKKELARVRDEIWKYYEKLKQYKINPTIEAKEKLWDEFDIVFEQKTLYGELKRRLNLTFAKKQELLTVLDYPNTPLHNNLSENGVREMVIKRKISGGVETDDGRKAWENNMSILATCKKCGVSYYDYMKNIFSCKKQNISLPDLIMS